MSQVSIQDAAMYAIVNANAISDVSVIGDEYHAIMDEVEYRLMACGAEKRGYGETLDSFPVVHRFTPGMYIREFHASAGSICTSMVHRQDHPFVISKGSASVLQEGVGWVRLTAPHTGITKAGTRRLLLIHEDLIWTTFHVTDLTDIEELERSIWYDRPNPLLVPVEIEAGSIREETTCQV